MNKTEENTKPVLRFMDYNVERGLRTNPDEVAGLLINWRPDIVSLNEVPEKGWTGQIGEILGLHHSYQGSIADANCKDAYKSIISRWPLDGKKEFRLAESGGWPAASIIRAVADIEGSRIAIYSLHAAGDSHSPETSHSYDVVTRILPAETVQRIVLMGDFNSLMDGAVMGLYKTAGFSDTWTSLSIDTRKTFTCYYKEKEVIVYIGKDASGGRNYGVIDHILFNRPESTKAKDGGIIEMEKPLADHKPVWADIEFAPEEK